MKKITAWEAHLARLVAYKAMHGDCNVPQGWAGDPGLGRWVSNQRSRKRKLDRGELTEPRDGGEAGGARLLESATCRLVTATRVDP
jgi:hypothetical protein